MIKNYQKLKSKNNQQQVYEQQLKNNKYKNSKQKGNKHN